VNRPLELLLLAPALLPAAAAIAAAAVAVKIDSAGPALYAQTRVGRHRRPFLVRKLRTMQVNADVVGPHVTAKNDSRVTRVGRWLRASKLDELPQLFSVLIGEMSLVGPRPEAPRYVEHSRPEWERVFDVRPGITDLASLAFRHEEELLGLAVDRERAYVEILVPAKMELALRGIEQSSSFHDLGIVLQTLAAVVGLKSAEHPALAGVREKIARLNAASAIVLPPSQRPN